MNGLVEVSSFVRSGVAESLVLLTEAAVERRKVRPAFNLRAFELASTELAMDTLGENWIFHVGRNRPSFATWMIFGARIESGRWTLTLCMTRAVRSTPTEDLVKLLDTVEVGVDVAALSPLAGVRTPMAAPPWSLISRMSERNAASSNSLQ